MSDVPIKIVEHIHWLGHDSFRIDQPLVIYIDPWRLPPGSPAADLILVSHDHHDHCSPEDVERVRQSETTVIANPSAAAKLTQPITILRAGESLQVGGVNIEAVPAYNIGKSFHPKEAGHVGFVITIAGERLYFAGDTDRIPEMKGLECDVALIPVSGTYVMTAEEAAEAVEDIRPKLAIPMHYGAGVAGTRQDAIRFRSLSTVPVTILETTGS
ncbi:MAG: MBL fold metallo-hydrolase [Anaerolineales bacterium]|nr:MBL fold metallo-hydrolase [Anaerolineales bacterium]